MAGLGSSELALLLKIRSDSAQARGDVTGLRSHYNKELKEIDSTSKTTASSVGGLGSRISSLLNPTNLLAGAGIAAGAAVFGLGKQAFDAAGQLFDLHQKTNISVESLSAMKNAGALAGVDINTLGAAFGILQKNMVAAQNPTSKQSSLFKQLGIDTNDVEQALRDSFKALMAMPEGANQTAVAMQLFGRSGKDVLAVLKEMDGDLDGAIAKYREMNTLITHDVAKSVDDLGDSFTKMGQQAGGAALSLVHSLTPALKGLVFVLNSVISYVKGLGTVLDALFNNPMLRQLDRYGALADKVGNAADRATRAGGVNIPGIGLAQEGQARRQGYSNLLRGETGIPGLNQFEAMLGRGGSRGGSGGGGSSRGRDAKGADDFGAVALERLNKQYDNLISKTTLARTASELLDAQYQGMDKSLRNQILAKAALIDQYQKEQRLADDTKRFIEQQTEAVRQKTEGDKSAWEELEELIESYREQGRVLKDNVLIHLQMNALLLDTARYVKAVKDLGPIDVDGLLPDSGTRGADDQTIGADGMTDMSRQINEMVGMEAPKPPAPDFSVWKESVQDVKDMTVGAFTSMGQAIGSVIEQFVMYGNTGGQSIKKVMAQVLAAVAAEAGVKAIFQLAEGFAKLAGFMPGAAALHFKSAALYGAVALSAGVAGRVLASGAGAQGAGASDSGGGGNSRTGFQQSQPQPMDVNRRLGEQRIVLEVRSNDSHIVRVVTQDYENRGEVRKVILGDGMRATA